MEHVSLKLGDDAAYDDAVHNSLPDFGDLTVITKDVATTNGAAGAVLTFHTNSCGHRVRVQTTTTVNCLRAMLKALEGRYDDHGMLLPHLRKE